MTVSMEHKNHRKSSWDSRVSASTASNGTRQYRRSASSILSSDSDIRFTRRKLSPQYKCGCCIVASFLFLLLAGAAAIYVGYTFYLSHPSEEQIFRAAFKVTDGDTYTSELADLSTNAFRVKSREYKERLNLLFRRSEYSLGFGGTEILALDGTEGQDLVVHFNVHMDPLYVTVDAEDVQAVLAKEFSSDKRLYFANLTVDPSSLEVTEAHIIRTTTTQKPTSRYVLSEAVTRVPPPPRKCSPMLLEYCKKSGRNTTTYPNLLGHENLEDLNKEVIAFRELVDAECYRLAYDFLCHVLQPVCTKGRLEDGMVVPCRSYCREFLAGCGTRLSARLKEALDCNRFPEFEGVDSCITKPDCVKEMQTRALSPRLCDGTADCEDVSDELSCSYCPPGQIHCGVGRVCIRNSKRCDGRRDCPDGSDERSCLGLAPSVEQLTKARVVTPHLTRYHADGHVVFNEKGEVGKLCTENLNRTLSQNRSDEILHTVAASLCKTLMYNKVSSFRVETDNEDNVSYVSMRDPTATDITFVRSSCRNKQVLRVTCEDLECGTQVTHLTGSPVLSKMANHGDWPWHVALLKEDVHICDGTLIDEHWVVTSTSCFQGQPKAEWLVRAGSVRLSSTSPWQQERRIVGMVKSPVEGSTIALVKLEDPLVMNDFVRPACLPGQGKGAVVPQHCNTLGWARNRDQLQRVQIKVNQMEKCENVSIATVNSLCTETAYGQEDCSEEEFAGTSMLCLLPDGVRWSLVGVTNWRIACSKTNTARPRMYDKITSNIEWIYDTINAETV